jgi:early secretory antigenic target protein ESAT-6
MSDGLLVVNFGALQQASADIQKALTTLEAQLSQLEQDASPLIATWDGAARDAFFQRQTTWRNSSEDLKGILRDIKIAVDESAADYLNTEQRATNLFS